MRQQTDLVCNLAAAVQQKSKAHGRTWRLASSALTLAAWASWVTRALRACAADHDS